MLRCVFAVYLSEVLADRNTEHELGVAAAAELRDAFVERQRRWLGKRRLQEDGRGGVGRRKVARKPTLQLMKAFEHMLNQSCGRSLLDFQPAPVTAPSSWPHLAISGDADSENMAMYYFLAGKLGLNIQFWPDPSHQYQRDMILSWSAMGWGPWTKLILVALNLLQGPWDAASRYWEYRLAGEELHVLLEEGEHPFLLAYESELQMELGLEHARGEPDMQLRLLAAMRSVASVETRGAKVAMCRFASLVDGLETLVPRWTTMLLRTIHVLSDGAHVGKKDVSEALKRTEVHTDAGGRAKTKAPAGKLRDACTNNLSLTCALLGDPDGRQRAHVIVECSGPLRAWHGAQAKKLRSVYDLRSWVVSQCRGGLQQPLLETLKVLRNASSVHKCGLSTMGVNVPSPPDMCRLLEASKADEGLRNIKAMVDAVASCEQRSEWWRQLASRSEV
eukprot:6477261-Amphidinium_carterae.1